MILNLFRNYHIQTLGLSNEKYPFELACAEILEVLRLFFNLEQDWEWVETHDFSDDNLLETNSYSEDRPSFYTLSIDVRTDFSIRKLSLFGNSF